MCVNEWLASRPDRFTPQKEPQVSIREEAWWASELVWTMWRVKIVALTGARTWTHLSSRPQQVAIPVELSRLLILKWLDIWKFSSNTTSKRARCVFITFEISVWFSVYLRLCESELKSSVHTMKRQLNRRPVEREWVLISHTFRPFPGPNWPPAISAPSAAFEVNMSTFGYRTCCMVVKLTSWP